MALNLRTLAVMYADRGDPANAVQLMERALKIQTAALPADSPAIEKTREGLAQLYEQVGRPDAAQRLREQPATKTAP